MKGGTTVAEKKKLTRVEILKAMLEAGEEVKELKVKVGDETLVFQYRPMGWLAKSRCLSVATEYRAEMIGKETVVKVTIHQDVYKKAALREMLVEPPIPMTDTVLDSLPSEIGDQFEAIIPNPLTSGEAAAPKKG